MTGPSQAFWTWGRGGRNPTLPWLLSGQDLACGRGGQTFINHLAPFFHHTAQSEMLAYGKAIGRSFSKDFLGLVPKGPRNFSRSATICNQAGHSPWILIAESPKS